MKRRTPARSHNGKTLQSNGGSISIEKDFYAWLREQATALREQRLEGLDWENIAEELARSP